MRFSIKVTKRGKGSYQACLTAKGYQPVCHYAGTAQAAATSVVKLAVKAFGKGK
jgi:hypothetical protein